MQTRTSTKGQVILSHPIRRELGLGVGDALEVKVEGGRIVLAPRRTRSQNVRILPHDITRFPVLSWFRTLPTCDSGKLPRLQVHQSDAQLRQNRNNKCAGCRTWSFSAPLRPDSSRDGSRDPPHRDCGLNAAIFVSSSFLTFPVGVTGMASTSRKCDGRL
jgi:AbrB family looped-hinge helix DNA binding protein